MPTGYITSTGPSVSTKDSHFGFALGEGTVASARDRLAFVATDQLAALGQGDVEEYEGIPCEFCHAPS